MTARLFTASERGLATLRTRAFRHVHDLSMLTQNTERRGALVSRVTSDVDQVSQFLQFGGVSASSASARCCWRPCVMPSTRWQLTLLVLGLLRAAVRARPRYFQPPAAAAYGAVRVRVGDDARAPSSEPVVGAATVRAYGDRASAPPARIDRAIAAHQPAPQIGRPAG